MLRPSGDAADFGQMRHGRGPGVRSIHAMQATRETLSVIGDWMGCSYDVGGRRWEFHLFLDHDWRYERTIRGEADYERRDAGRWEYEESNKVLRLMSDKLDGNDKMSESWRVLSVSTCEDSNVLLVLRKIILASRNLPILLYRVHCNGRGYGTGWEDRLSQR